MNSIQSSDSESYEYDKIRVKQRSKSELPPDADLRTIHRKNRISNIFETFLTWIRK